MLRRVWALALAFLLACGFPLQAFAATLGPAASYEELQTLLASAKEGDTIMITGEISAKDAPPLSSPVSVHLKSSGGAVISGLHLQDASLSLSGVTLTDSLTISGTSHVQLGSRVSVSGAAGKAGLSFSGNGTLIVEGGCSIEGGSGNSGVSIRHTGGEFFSSIEGSVRGGSGSSGSTGSSGGPGMVISPLQESGAVMITGSIEGGSASGVGGHALNLYELSGNAFVTVDGQLQGGRGSVGGDGIQIVSASDFVNVGISGQTRGGDGEHFGGDALILMNTQDSSFFHITGHLSGGNATGENAQPGTSLQLVGDSAASRARIDNCLLEDGKKILSTPEPVVTPAPTSEPTPVITPLPSITPPSEDFATMITPEPTAEPTPEPTVEPTAEPTPEPTAEPEPAAEE